ncbi:MAG: cyclic nucleotide-binding domain-containing protein [Gammaproteobacteria bacterium]|nr:cyclic nucleotide-binding domain-containing protein [Gammaproteobacteria bacterium]MBL6999324.1 cyclic nucleotide-binding domain-containing protein [Gammaproteobacteria bacterium]
MPISGEYFYSIAALFSCSAYLLRNILWLRILLVIASCIYIFSGISLGISSMVGWNSAYLAINLYHVGLLLLDKITITLPEETRNIYHQYFSLLSTREFRKLVMTNPFCSFNDSTIIQQFEVTDKLYIVLTGKVNIMSAGRVIAELNPGDLIGEMSFMSNEPASANAIALGMVECAYWTHADLEKLKLKKIDVYNKFLSIIGCDLVRKLKKKNEDMDQQTTKLDFIL